MKLSERVQLLYCPDHRGTITRIWKNGDFRVSFDSHNHTKNEPRMKVTYPASKVDLFVREGAIESADLTSSDILDDLLKRYGIGT